MLYGAVTISYTKSQRLFMSYAANTVHKGALR